MGVGHRLKINRIAAPVTSLGPGRRLGLWVQGCTIGCAGCASTDTWEAAGGVVRPVEQLVPELADRLDQHELSGLTISGGEPLQQATSLTALLTRMRRIGALESRDVLLFTGYAWSRAQRIGPRVLDLVDAVVSGPYVASRPGDGNLLASGNQEMTLLTDLARTRFARPDTRRIQVGQSSGNLVMAGLPDAGDLDRFRLLMAKRGIEFGSASWEA
ncbi:4Fe-4S single cluster domain-containing protein [Aeromicrobium duanguangcaii]|uniref:Radical SAM protein n=1 Tax=Aeromicrobium duanguangcaii TaxID=2968086 RepID=A0ABY5KDR5_9ACTN|nr:4Fe-4S single cluster domain-containing protein [Aeromicrobium duanguangcaii]MCD9152793.1 radical SAM protein [Aeromicrobium duanguangcaii]UUI67225.1 radical SAM protein [Aeromicrobium duanguangcaii]